MKRNWIKKILDIFKDFIIDTNKKTLFEIVDLYECNKTGITKAVIKFSKRHIQEKNINDIILNNDLIDHLDSKTIRTLTYIATVEKLKPDYSILVQHMSIEIDEYLLEIKSKVDSKIFKKSPSEISNDLHIISKFNPIDANKIGYMAGVRDTVKEYKIRQTI